MQTPMILTNNCCFSKLRSNFFPFAINFHDQAIRLMSLKSFVFFVGVSKY